jgi:hypothetical protein
MRTANVCVKRTSALALELVSLLPLGDPLFPISHFDCTAELQTG